MKGARCARGQKYAAVVWCWRCHGPSDSVTFVARGWAVTGLSRTERRPMKDGIIWVAAEIEDNIGDEAFLDGNVQY